MYRGLDEQALARLCTEGDRSAGEELYIRYAAQVYTLCRRYTDRPDDAKDLMQETMLKALDRIATYRYGGEGSLYAWIRRIAINLALNQIKKRRWRLLPLDSVVADRTPEPEASAVASIPQEKLLEWIAGLPDLRRAVFNLYCMDGYSHREIGEMLGISEKGSAGILAKARRQLKEEISRYLKDKER